MMPREDDQVDGDKLRQLRQERGWDWVQLARLSSLSVSQVQALEEGGADCFYSLQIKNNAARKLAKVLGVPENSVFTHGALPAAQVQEVFDHQVVPQEAVVNSRILYAKSSPATWIGYGVMALFLFSGLAWWALKPSTITMRPYEVIGAVSTSSKTTAPTESDKLTAKPDSAEPALVPPALAQVPAVAPSTPSLASAPSPEGQAEITPASLSAVAELGCRFEGDVAVLEALNPTKSAEKVSLMLHKAGLLCVQDSTGKVWQENLKPWLGRTFVGKAPWKLYSPALPNADVYFQGEKIKLVSVNARTIALNGKEFDR